MHVQFYSFKNFTKGKNSINFHFCEFKISNTNGLVTVSGISTNIFHKVRMAAFSFYGFTRHFRMPPQPAVANQDMPDAGNPASNRKSGGPSKCLVL